MFQAKFPAVWADPTAKEPLTKLSWRAGDPSVPPVKVPALPAILPKSVKVLSMHGTPVEKAALIEQADWLTATVA